MLTQRLWNFYFRALENADELEGVNDGLALKVIVGDDESVARVFGDLPDAGDPRSELFGGVEIVVAFMGRDGGVVGKPSIVAATVETHVANGRSDLGGRGK